KAILGKDQDLQKKKEDLDRRLDALSRLQAMDRSENGETVTSRSQMEKLPLGSLWQQMSGG
ncbi:hypothetical protein E2320_006650, partial [Naja naja]